MSYCEWYLQYMTVIPQLVTVIHTIFYCEWLIYIFYCSVGVGWNHSRLIVGPFLHTGKSRLWPLQVLPTLVHVLVKQPMGERRPRPLTSLSDTQTLCVTWHQGSPLMGIKGSPTSWSIWALLDMGLILMTSGISIYGHKRDIRDTKYVHIWEFLILRRSYRHTVRNTL